MNFFLSEEILGGEDWYKWIKERLVETNLLLLLFTDSSLNWGWCLYEAGLSDRLDDEHRRRIICLHSRSTEPPDPLKKILQSFSAEPFRLKSFLRALYLERNSLRHLEPAGLRGCRRNWIRFPKASQSSSIGGREEAIF